MELNTKEVIKRFLYNSLVVFFGLFIYAVVMTISTLGYYLMGLIGGAVIFSGSLALIITVFYYCSPSYQPTKDEDKRKE